MLPLSNDGMGGLEDQERITQISDGLYGRISEGNFGEFDGNEIGGGICTFFMYGDDADKLSEAVLDVLRGRAITGVKIVIRYGPLGSRERHVGL